MCASLVLLSENGGQLPDCGVHLVLCGDHAMYVRDRPPGLDMAPYTEGPGAQAHIENHVARLLATGSPQNRAEAEALVDLECSYARRNSAGGPFVVSASTLPYKVGTALAHWEGATLEPDAAGLSQVAGKGLSRGVGVHVSWRGKITQPSTGRVWGVESWVWR